jgi:4-amino-4-deoxy-L-arabinose transferase-like glycosyltransferase
MSAPRSPSGDGADPRPGVPGRLIAVVLIAAAIRVIVAANLHLTEDEAYYRLWSMAPAFGYYDHPPMIAWWIWLGRWIAGDTPLGVRLMPIAASALASLLVFDIARLIGAAQADARRAGVWYNAMPLVAAGGFLAVPDAPAALFWVLTLWCALKAARGGLTGWWVAAGLMAGLTALSKYSALFLAPGIVLWLAWRPSTRRLLRTPGPWLAAAIAIAVFGLNIAWNADHRWLTFAKQFGRIAPSHFAPGHLATFLAAQVLLINPLIAMFLARGLASPRTKTLLTPLIATSAPFIAYLLVHSLHDSVQAHWPAPVYPALAICAAVAAGEVSRARRWSGLARAAPIVGFAIYPLALLVLCLPPPLLTPVAGPILGWPRFAERLEGVRMSRGAAWIGTLSYGLAAQLADERATRAPIAQIDERERYLGLKMPLPDFTRPGLIVDLARRVDPRGLAACFVVVEPLGAIKRVEPSTPAKTYVLYEVAGPRRDVLGQGCRP